MAMTDWNSAGATQGAAPAPSASTMPNMVAAPKTNTGTDNGSMSDKARSVLTSFEDELKQKSKLRAQKRFVDSMSKPTNDPYVLDKIKEYLPAEKPTGPETPAAPTPTAPTSPAAPTSQPMAGSDYLAAALGVAGSAGTTFSGLMQPGQLQTQNLAEPLQRQFKETLNTAQTAAGRRMRGLTNPAPGVQTDLAGRVLNSDGTIAKNAQPSVLGRVDRNKDQQTAQNTQANTQTQQPAQPFGGAVAQKAGVTKINQNGKDVVSYTRGNTQVVFDEGIDWNNDDVAGTYIAMADSIMDSWDNGNKQQEDF